MKHILIIAAMVLAISQAKAQDSTKKYKIGIEAAYAKPSQYKKDGFFPSLTLSKRNQMFFAGAGIVYYDYAHPQPLYGWQAGYRLFPNGKNKKLNLFFEANVHYVQGEIEDRVPSFISSYYWIPGSGKRIMHLATLDNYIGFGFTWNISKRFYLSSNLGASLGLYKQEYTYIYPDSQTWTSDGNFVMRGHFNSIFKIALGYDLFKF